MDNIQKLEARVLELAALHEAAVNELNACAAADGFKPEVSEKLAGEVDRAHAELSRAQAELLAARTAEYAPAGDTFQQLVERCEVRNYIASAISDNKLSGAEAELNEQLHGNAERGALGGVRIPWRLLAGDEQRADAPSSLPAGAGPSSERDFIGRVFRSSVTDWLGVKTEQVPVGEATYTVLTAGASADILAPSANKESTAATISKVDLNPKRLTTRYTVRVEDLARSNLYEMGLREDLAGVLRQKVDEQVLNGSGSAPEVAGMLAELPAATGATTNTAAYGDYVLRISSAVDGLYASELRDLRVLANPDVYTAMVNAYRSDESDLMILGWLQMFSGGIRASAHMPAKASNVGRMLISKTGATDMQPNACAAFWNSPELIRDNYTSAGKGEVHLTLMQLWDFAVLREDAWTLRRVKI